MLYYLFITLLVVTPFIWLRMVKKLSWKKIFFELLPKRKTWRSEFFGALKLFTLLIIAFVVISAITTIVGFNDLQNVNNAIDEQVKEGVIVFAVTLGVVLFVEEFFFRAFLQKRIGIILSTVVFALLHLGYGSIAEIIGVFALGLILAYWYKKNNSLFQNYLGHVIYDIIAIALYLAI